MTEAQSFPLNFLEFGYVAFDGLMRSTPQTYLLRFNTALDAAALRAIARELVSANPRLRSVVEPSKCNYRLLVLPDGPVVDQLFEQAWEEHAHVDASNATDIEALHRHLHNQVMPLERGLMCKFAFVSHATEPVLFVSVHHIVGDGRTMLHFVSEICKRLNGGPPMVLQSVEAPPLSQVFGPAAWWQYPGAIWRSLRHEKRERQALQKLQVVRLEHEASPYLSTQGLRHYRVPVPASVLRKAARHLDISLNGLVVLAMMETFLRMAPTHTPHAATVIRQAMDVRHLYPKSLGYGPLWGNHVGVFLLAESGHKSLADRARSIRQQIDQHVQRYANHEVFGRYAFMGLVPWMGRTWLSHVATQMVRQTKLPQLSCYATNVGSIDRILPADAPIRLKEMMACVTSPTFLLAVSEINDTLLMVASWQRSEFSEETLDNYLQQLSATFVQLSQLT